MIDCYTIRGQFTYFDIILEQTNKLEQVRFFEIKFAYHVQYDCWTIGSHFTCFDIIWKQINKIE